MSRGKHQTHQTFRKTLCFFDESALLCVAQANHVTKKGDAFATAALTDSDRRQIRKLSKEPGIARRIFASMAPSIYGPPSPPAAPPRTPHAPRGRLATASRASRASCAAQRLQCKARGRRSEEASVSTGIVTLLPCPSPPVRACATVAWHTQATSTSSARWRSRCSAAKPRRSPRTASAATSTCCSWATPARQASHQATSTWHTKQHPRGTEHN